MNLKEAPTCSTEVFSEEELYPQIKEVFGIEAISGLPCGVLREFIKQSYADREIVHVPTTNERESVGVATGMWLAGKETALYMQNSGLFVCSNDIGSVLIANQIPILIISSWRGSPGETATQHQTTGQATPKLLEAFNLPHVIEPKKNDLIKLRKNQREKQLPVCVLKKRTAFNKSPSSYSIESEKRSPGETVYLDEKALINREQALLEIMGHFSSNQAIFSSTGLISRSIYHHYDDSNYFYNAGGFGLTSSIALGFAVTRPEIESVVIEGDGSVLSNLGNLNLVGHQQPHNFLHIILDNRSYLSCSGEPTFGSDQVPQLASQLGYRQAITVAKPEDIQSAINLLKSKSGPQMLRILINQEGQRSFKRPNQMPEIARRFRNHFGT